MQDFSTMDLDSMMKDIIEIFNLEGVELVRLSGLYRRELRISNCKALDIDMLDRIVHKLKQQKIIHYRYILKCPHCGEVAYQITERQTPTQIKVCDTCMTTYIPTKDVSLLEFNENMI